MLSSAKGVSTKLEDGPGAEAPVATGASEALEASAAWPSTALPTAVAITVRRLSTWGV